MKKLKIGDTLHRIIDGFEVNESSREVKYSNVKIDFTGKSIADLPLKYQECQLVEETNIEATDGQRIEGTSFQVNSKKDTLSEIEYVKGQTSQSGTPIPSSPQPINVVSGRQVVRVRGKNLWGGFTWEKTTSGITFSYSENGIVNVSGTSTATAQSMSLAEGQQHTITLDNGTYAISGGTADIFVQALDYDGNELAITNATTFTKTFTLTETKQVFLRYRVLSGKTLNTPFYPMLSKGSTIPPYEEYKGQSYELDLGKNLFNDTIRQGVTTYNGGVYSYNATRLTSTEWTILPAGTYTINIKSNANDLRVSCITFDTNENFYNISGVSGQWKTLPFTFTSPINIKWKCNICFNDNRTIKNSDIYDIQLEKGSEATSYAPYKTPIYLGKIGNYKDYIFRNTPENPLYDSNLEEGQWYIHKEIGRVVLNGSETWNLNNSYTYNVFYTTIDTLKKEMNVITTMSNYYKGVKNGGLADFGNTYNNSIAIRGYNDVYYHLYISNDAINSVADFKIWLSTHNTEVYYVLNTPTNTLIEDEELINQLESIELLEGLNNVMVSSPYLSGIIGLHYNFRNAEYYIDTIYTGYVNNYTLPKMKNKLEYRELDIDLLSPLALATLRTADAVGTYNLQNLIREIIQPLIDDGFTLKELNVGNNQVSVNYLTETIESALNKLSNKFNFWWYIDKNKNIFINDINYLFSKKYKLTYDNDNKINGLIDFTPSMESIDYCNTIDFTNVRLITKSSFTKYYYRLVDEGYMTDYSYYNPIKPIQTIYPGDEIEFDIPFIINTSKRGISETSPSTQDECYFRLYNITPQPETASTYDLLVELKGDNNNQVIIPNNVAISDSFNNDKEFVFVRDNFFSNLIIGMKYNGNSQIDVGIIESDTALMWSKIRINNNKEIEVSKNKISNTGIIERQFDMREMWLTYEELLEISNSLIKKNDVNVEKVELVADIENDLNIGDIINIDKPTFLTTGSFIITDKIRRYYDNVDSWVFRLNNTNILESYVDLFRSSEEEEQTDKVFNLITGDYSNEGINERYGFDLWM